MGNVSTEFTEHVSHMICFLTVFIVANQSKVKSDYEFSIVSACGMSLYKIWKPTVFWVIFTRFFLLFFRKLSALNDSNECEGFSLSPIIKGLHNTILYCFTFFLSSVSCKRISMIILVYSRYAMQNYKLTLRTLAYLLRWFWSMISSLLCKFLF